MTPPHTSRPNGQNTADQGQETTDQGPADQGQRAAAPGQQQADDRGQQAADQGQQTGDQGQQTRTGGQTTDPPPQREFTAGERRMAGAGGGAAAAGLIGAALTGATGSSVVGTHESLMPIATIAAFSAGVILPPALLVAFAFREGTGKTTKLEKCSQEWEKAAKELEAAAREIDYLVKAIPGQAWTMDDRPLYEKAVEDFKKQVEALTAYFSAVQQALMITAWALFAYSVFAAAMGAFLGGLAAVAAGALASVFGSVGYVKCLSLSIIARNVTVGALALLAAAGAVSAGVMVAKAHSTADTQEKHGAAGADAALGRAWATGSAGALANITEAGVNSVINFATKQGGVPTGQIDLDADRAIDKTWNVGGGGKITTPAGIGEVETGYHAKVRDGDLQGQDVELKGKLGDPYGFGSGTLGGKLEWDERESLDKKTFVAGAESPIAGSKVEYEGTVNQKNDYSDKYNVNTPGFNRNDGSFNKAQEDETPPWDKNL